MGLTCTCGDDYEWYYHTPFEETLRTKRSRRCCSCGEKIRPGETVFTFPRWRQTRDEIEDRIHGDEVQLANQYMCEECGDLFSALNDLGFCLPIGNESMKELVREYVEMQSKRIA